MHAHIRMLTHTHTHSLTRSPIHLFTHSQRLKDAGMMDAFAEWQREEAEQQLMLIAHGQIDPAELASVNDGLPLDEEKPLYAFLLNTFDERVQVCMYVYVCACVCVCVCVCVCKRSTAWPRRWHLIPAIFYAAHARTRALCVNSQYCGVHQRACLHLAKWHCV